MQDTQNNEGGADVLDAMDTPAAAPPKKRKAYTAARVISHAAWEAANAAEDIAQLKELLGEDAAEADPQLWADTLEGETPYMDRLRRLGAFVAEQMALEEMARKEAQRITDRARAFKRNAEKGKEVLGRLTEALGLPGLTEAEFSLHFRDQEPGAVVIDDEEAIPLECKQRVVSFVPDKALIAARLNADPPVPTPGAHLSNGGRVPVFTRK